MNYIKTSSASEFVFITATSNQALIVAELIPRLSAEGRSWTILNCDQYYRQTAGARLTQLGIPSDPIPGKDLPDWCALERPQREPYLRSLTLWAWEYFSNSSISTLIVGNDTGDVEQICIRAAERYGIRTIRIQDGIQHLTPKERGLAQKHIHQESPCMYPTIPCEGGCDTYLLWSETLINEFRKKGMAGRSVLTGSIRHDEFTSIPKKIDLDKKQKWTIGVAGQAFEKFGDMWPAQELSLYEHIVQMCLARPGTEVILRPHPESAILKSYAAVCESFGPRVRFDDDTPLPEFLDQIDVLVTISSTMAVDSAALDIPSYRLMYLRTRQSTEDFEIQDAEYRKAFTDEGFPYSHPSKSVTDPAWFAEYHLGKIDGHAQERAMTELFKPQEVTAVNESTTVLIESTGRDPVPTLRSLFSTRDSCPKVYFIDRSTTGKMAREVKDLFPDKPLTAVHRPNASQAICLSEACSLIESQFILRLAAGTILLPGGLERFVQQSIEQPEAIFSSAWFLGRNECEAYEGLVIVPDQLTAELFEQFSSYRMLSFCYMVTKEKLLQTGGFRESPNTDVDLMCRLFAQANTPYPVAIHPTALFITPVHHPEDVWNNYEFHSTYYKRALTDKTVNPPLTSSSMPTTSTNVYELIEGHQYGDALLQISTSLQQDNGNLELLYLKALVEAKTQKFGDSLQSLEQVLHISQDHQEALTLKNYLQGLSG